MHAIRFIRITLTCFLLLLPFTALAQDGPSSAEELARKAQDPLADVRAIMTDNAISFGTADEETSYNFQIQPVYSIPTDRGYNFIARAIIPIIGAPAGAGLPPLGSDQTPDKGTKWGLSDTILQLFWTPKTDADIKFGLGPQVSIPTHTTERVAGPEWGAGVAGVFFGFSGELAYGAILGHHWGEHDFSVTTMQPVVYYNIAALPGSYGGYNNSITYNRNADSDDRWQVPVGLTAGKTMAIGSAGHALDLSLGAYGMALRPDGGADSGAAIGGFLGLVFGGDIGDVVEGAAVGAGAGAIGGAVSGSMKKKDAEKRGRQQQEQEQRRIQQEQKQSQQQAAQQAAHDQQAQEQALIKAIGEDNYRGLLALINCEHERAEALAKAGAASSNPDHKLSSLWLKALVANDLKQKDLTVQLYRQIVAADADIDTEQQASIETDKVLMDVRQERRDRGISCKL